MSDKEIYRWKLPEDHPDFTGHDDLPEAYTIEENPEATCGIVIFGKYRGEWIVNPWNTRTLVKHLFDRFEKAEAELEKATKHIASLESKILWQGNEIADLLGELTDRKKQDHDFRNGLQAVMTELDNRAEKAEAELAELRDRIEHCPICSEKCRRQ